MFQLTSSLCHKGVMDVFPYNLEDQDLFVIVTGSGSRGILGFWCLPGVWTAMYHLKAIFPLFSLY